MHSISGGTSLRPESTAEPDESRWTSAEGTVLIPELLSAQTGHGYRTENVNVKTGLNGPMRGS